MVEKEQADADSQPAPWHGSAWPHKITKPAPQQVPTYTPAQEFGK